LQINFAGRRLTVATSGGSGSWDWAMAMGWGILD